MRTFVSGEEGCGGEEDIIQSTMLLFFIHSHRANFRDAHKYT